MRAFTVLVGIISSFFLTSILFVSKAQGQIITVTAVVQQQRTIVVDHNLIIIQVISNTRDDVQPMVVLESPDGQKLPYSDGIVKQYKFLKPSLNFSEPGIIYVRKDRLIQTFYEKMIAFLRGA